MCNISFLTPRSLMYQIKYVLKKKNQKEIISEDNVAYLIKRFLIQ